MERERLDRKNGRKEEVEREAIDIGHEKLGGIQRLTGVGGFLYSPGRAVFLLYSVDPALSLA